MDLRWRLLGSLGLLLTVLVLMAMAINPVFSEGGISATKSPRLKSCQRLAGSRSDRRSRPAEEVESQL